LTSRRLPTLGTPYDLGKANLRGADLTFANFCFAGLNGADLSGANLTVIELKG